VVAPLTDLLKDAFKWSDRATKAFLNLKQVLAQAPMLTLPDFSQPFILETNVSIHVQEQFLTNRDIP